MGTKTIILEACVIAMVITVAYLIGAYSDQLDKYTVPALLGGYQSSDCKNMTIFQTKTCLENKLRQLPYKYNVSNLGKTLSLEQLKAEGGVCSHYSAWYEQMLNSTDFNVKRVPFKMNENYSHVVDIISNEDGYCILDQLDGMCWVTDKKSMEGINWTIHSRT
jgi:hypothetical protein